LIRLTRLSGHEFWLSADLIESLEATPDTVIVLVDGHRLVVKEDPADVVDAVVDFRASILTRAGILSAPVDVVDEAHLSHAAQDALNSAAEDEMSYRQARRRPRGGDAR